MIQPRQADEGLLVYTAVCTRQMQCLRRGYAFRSSVVTVRRPFWVPDRPPSPLTAWIHKPIRTDPPIKTNLPSSSPSWPQGLHDRWRDWQWKYDRTNGRVLGMRHETVPHTFQASRKKIVNNVNRNRAACRRRTTSELLTARRDLSAAWHLAPFLAFLSLALQPRRAPKKTFSMSSHHSPDNEPTKSSNLPHICNNAGGHSSFYTTF